MKTCSQIIKFCFWETHCHTGKLNTHTHTHNRFTALWNLYGTTRMSRYQNKHSPTHTHRGHQSSLSAFSIYYDTWLTPYSPFLNSVLFYCAFRHSQQHCPVSTHFSATNIPTPSSFSSPPIQNSLYHWPLAP